MGTRAAIPSLFAAPAVGASAMLVPVLAPMLHYVRWSPAEGLAFMPSGRGGVALGVKATREWCPVCRAPVANPDGTAQEDQGLRFRGAVTPSWCCLREIQEVRRC